MSDEFTNEEKEILESFDKGTFISVKGKKKSLENYQSYAQAALAKDKRINIRISSRVLEGLQVKALEEGMPYQTLISSILHKYISGRLSDDNE